MLPPPLNLATALVGLTTLAKDCSRGHWLRASSRWRRGSFVGRASPGGTYDDLDEEEERSDRSPSAKARLQALRSRSSPAKNDPHATTYIIGTVADILLW